jgi:hypothetical protein
MDINTIKKELYKQKPIAEFGYTDGIFAYYSTELTIGGSEEIINFKVPETEADGFDKSIPAQLLIRWLVK